MAVPLLSNEHVVQQLWRRKCQMVKDYGHHVLWKTTKTKHHFTVPEEGPDEQCSAYVFEEILKEIDTLQGRRTEVYANSHRPRGFRVLNAVADRWALR